MKWFKKSFTNNEKNKSDYRNAIRGLDHHLHNHPEKYKEFAVFKESIENGSHTLYFSPTTDPNFTSIINNDLNSEEYDKPDTSTISFFIGDEQLFEGTK